MGGEGGAGEGGGEELTGRSKATQDADNVVILQRHQGRHYLDVRKYRYDGDLGVVPLAFQTQTGTLVEVEDNGLGLSLERESMYGVGVWKPMGSGGGGDRPVVRERMSH
ncbi:hypothetical protein NSK_001242 [Nannochloropsis salina CCMP1776]|jgi:hypothetical protein|uniref:Uncharacterized protein n=1 Tax=Nannochloropsis salina CCMP1776 TaxID=1027361 RepID=A0A4D9DE67_9STRA|nr:hypothetical protein NSK_001242 [Nannochloropsis salina CCMP1776]|eukprot:TFJ87895.1 hypothetical protein NSK_001242 [Nannochloropsis salina CCMP1776]